MEDLVIDPRFWSKRRVFLTGHTGFKGSWLALWLSRMGAEVFGYSLVPPTTPSLFNVAQVESKIADHVISDIRDAIALTRAMERAAPDIVMHLAAQPLVRYSYAEPVETFETNVMGTVNVFEAVRTIGSVKAMVSVTTDKCYLNREWLWPYREDEALGGHDPYSASKACAEIVGAAYRSSFSSDGPWIASARAGNVIGGGDWALDRIVPDALRAIESGATMRLRSPGAVRPWQHVLEPLSGYVALAQRLYDEGSRFATAWNFGPDDADARPVSWIVEKLAAMDNRLRWIMDGAPSVHEAGLLKLDSSRARSLLGWKPRWNLEEALARTMEWHHAWTSGSDMAAICGEQIDRYIGGKNV